MPYPPNNFALDEDQRRSIEAARLGSPGPTAPAMPAYRIGPTPGLTASGRRLGELQFGAGPLQQPVESFGTPTDFARELLGGMAAAPGTALKSLVHGGQYLGNVAGQVGEFFGLPQNLNPEGNKRPEDYGAYRLGQGIEDMAARHFGGAEPTFMGRVGGATGFVGRMAGAGALAGPPGVMAAAAGESMAPSYDTATALGADSQTATLRAAQSGVLNAGLMGLGGPTAMIDRVLGSTAEQVAKVGVYESMRRLGAEAIKGGFNMSALAAATTVGESAIQEQPMSLRNTLESAAEAFPVGMVVGGGAKLVGEARLPGPGIRESIRTEGEAAAARIAEKNTTARSGLDPNLFADYGKVGMDIVAGKSEPAGKIPERVLGEEALRNLPKEKTLEEEVQRQQAPQGQEGLLVADTKPGGDSTIPPATSAKQEIIPPTADAINKAKWFHGSGTPGLSRDVLDPLGVNHESLFGQGVYLTDNRGVAETYAKNRGSKRGKQPTLYESQIEVKNPINADAPITPEVAKILTEASYPDFKGVVAAEAKKPGATFAGVFKKLREAVSDHSNYEQIPTTEFVEMFQNILGDLSGAGYDAITYEGGHRAGKGKILHRAVVLLDPKSAKTFAPSALETARAGEVKPTTLNKTNEAELTRRSEELTRQMDSILDENLASGKSWDDANKDPRIDAIVKQRVAADKEAYTIWRDRAKAKAGLQSDEADAILNAINISPPSDGGTNQYLVHKHLPGKLKERPWELLQEIYNSIARPQEAADFVEFVAGNKDGKRGVVLKSSATSPADPAILDKTQAIFNALAETTVGDGYSVNLNSLKPSGSEFKPSRAPRMGETIPPPPKGVLPFKEAIPKGQVTEGVPGSDPTKMHKGAQIPFEKVGTLQPGEAREMVPEDMGTAKGPPPKEGVLDTNKLPEGAFANITEVGGRDIAGRVMEQARREGKEGSPEAAQAIYTIAKRMRKAAGDEKGIAASVAQRTNNLVRELRADSAAVEEMTKPVELKSITGKPVQGAYWTAKTDAIEGRAEKSVGGLVGTEDYPGLSGLARKATLEFRRIYDKVLGEAKKRGDRWMQDQQGNWYHAPTVSAEGRVPRFRTEAEHRIWTDKYDANHKNLIRILAEANGIEVKSAQEIFDKAMASSGDRTVGALSVARAFKIFPEAVDDVSSPGKKIWLIEPDPIKHLQSGVPKIARQGAFNANFPQGSLNELEAAALEKAKNPGAVKVAIDRARRAAQGAPLKFDEWLSGAAQTATDPNMGVIATVASGVGKAIKASDTVAKGLALTASAAQQVVEPAGAVPTFTGAKNLAKGYGKTLASPFKSNEKLTEMGVIWNHAIDSRPTDLQGIAKTASSLATTVSGFTPVNQANAVATGMAGAAFVHEMRMNAAAGAEPNASTVDALYRLKFTKGQIRNLVSGKASAEMYNDVGRRIVTYTQGENQTPLEKPVSGYSKVVNAIQPFLRYANLSTDMMASGLQNFTRSMEKARDMPNGPGKSARTAAAIKSAATFFGGKTAAGAATVALTAMVLGRPIRRDDESWAEWTGKNLLAGGIGAQGTSIYYRTKQATESSSNPIPDVLLGGNPTVSVITNAVKAAQNAREYKDLEPLEAMWQLAKQTTPGLRIPGGIAVTAGFGENPYLQRAIKKSYELRKELGYLEGGVDKGFDQFSHDIKQLVRAMKQGDQEETLGLYAKILKDFKAEPPASSARERVDASVRGRLTLAGKSGSALSPEDRELFKQKLGERDYKLLEAYDKAMMSITNENLGAAGEFYYKLHTLRADFKASKNIKKPRELAIAEAFSGKINDVQKVIDKKGDDPERLKRLSATKEKLFNLAVKRLSLPDTGNAKINLDAEVDRIMQEMN